MWMIATGLATALTAVNQVKDTAMWITRLSAITMLSIGLGACATAPKTESLMAELSVTGQKLDYQPRG
jgi:hypothetical protein